MRVMTPLGGRADAIRELSKSRERLVKIVLRSENSKHAGEWVQLHREACANTTSNAKCCCMPLGLKLGARA